MRGENTLAGVPVPAPALSWNLEERPDIAQYWPFRTDSRSCPVNRKGSRLEVKESGSPNDIRITVLLVNSPSPTVLVT
jgi:hypothetical protein